MINILIYNLNIGRQIQRLLSVFDKYKLNLQTNSYEKQEFNVLWLYCLCVPLQTLHDSFLSFSVEQREEAYANSQTMLLTYRLNRRFDTVLQRIYLVNHTLNAPASNLALHFTVYVPAGVDVDSVRRFVSKYTIVDKNFAVV
jgi:hypothetical protein